MSTIRILLCFFFWINSICAFSDHSARMRHLQSCECQNRKIETCSIAILETCYSSYITNTIDLNNKQLSGTIPNNFFLQISKAFKDLQDLNLAANQLSGTLPRNIYLVDQLIELNLGYNAFTGVLPRGLSSLSSLGELSLDHNQLSGAFDALFNDKGGVVELQQLQVEYNNFNASVPAELLTLPYLYKLLMEHNNLVGTLPAIPPNATKSLLTMFSVSSNQLSGRVPSGYAEYFNKLTLLSLHNNKLSGRLPESLIQSTSLKVLHLATNGFRGPFPDAFSPGCKLEELLIQDNYFTGVLPSTIGRCSPLWALLAWRNGFDGQIPSSFGQLTNMQALDISANKIGGTLPLTLSSLVKMKTFLIADNRIGGKLCPALKGVKLQACNAGKNLLRCDPSEPKPDPQAAGCGGMSQCMLCNSDVCNAPNLAGAAFGTCLGTANKQSCAYECAPGYMPNSYQEITCENGEWVDIGQAECVFCNFCCGEVPQSLVDNVDGAHCRGTYRVGAYIGNSNISGHANSFADGICHFRCQPNFEAQGDTKIKCDRGSWVPPAKGVCEAMPCTSIDEAKLPHVDPESCPDGIEPGHPCFFRCKYPYSSLNGGKAQSIMCLHGSVWDYTNASCMIPSCSDSSFFLGLTADDYNQGTCKADGYKVVAVATPITAAGVMMIVFYFLYRKMIKNTRSWAVMVTMDSDGEVSLESDWYLTEDLCREVNFTTSENGEFESCMLVDGDPGLQSASAALVRRVKRFFQTGGVKRRNNDDRLTFVRMEIIRNDKLFTKFKAAVCNMERRITANPEAFAVRLPDDGVKPQLLKRLAQNYLHTPGLEHCHIVLAWHGCSPAATRSICAFGAVDLRKVDGGFFGSGIYLTPFSSYAATYSRPMSSESKTEDQGLHALVLCMVVLCNTYPISRKSDYPFPNIFDHGSYSHFHYLHPVPYNVETGKFELANAVRTDKGLYRGFDSHFARISREAHYQAVDTRAQADYDEIVVKAEEQVLPIAVVYFRKRTSPAEPTIESKHQLSGGIQSQAPNTQAGKAPSLLRAAREKFKSVRSFFGQSVRKRQAGLLRMTSQVDGYDSNAESSPLHNPISRRASDTSFYYGTASNGDLLQSVDSERKESTAIKTSSSTASMLSSDSLL